MVTLDFDFLFVKVCAFRIVTQQETLSTHAPLATNAK